MRLIVTPRASRDVQTITAYYRRTAGSAAWFIDRFEQAVGHLLCFPDSGVQVSHPGTATVRTWLVRPYQILYRTEADTLFVIAIVHSSRDWQQALS